MAVIRYARPGDEAELVELWASTYAASFGELWSPEGLAGFLARQVSAPRIRGELEDGDAIRYVVAERGGELVGFARILRDRPVTGLEGERGLWLHQLAASPKPGDEGAGGVLLEAVLGIAGALGEPRIWVEVLRPSVGAIRLYERHDFVRRLALPFATDLREVGMWVMTRLT